MGHVNTLFHQMLGVIPRSSVEKLSKQYQADYYVKDFRTWNHLVAMLFAQATGKDSLRDLEAAFNAQSQPLYHLGVKPIHRSTLADANERRNSKLFEQLYLDLLGRFQNLMPRRKFKFKNPFFVFDSTFIDLCLSLFPWAVFRKRKGAIKLHLRLDQDSLLPSVLVVTHGRINDVCVAPKLAEGISPDSIITFDRAYVSFNFLYSLTKRGIFFVTRAEANQDFVVVGQQPVPGRSNLVSDQIIRLAGPKSSRLYPEPLRLVTVFDPIKKQELRFLTNNFKFAASTIAQIYRLRWQIELFFKWLKQNLKIKSFLGDNQNAVCTQIWCAMIYYLVLAYIKAQTRFWGSLHTLTEILSVTLFQRISLLDILSLDARRLHHTDPPQDLQLNLPLVI